MEDENVTSTGAQEVVATDASGDLTVEETPAEDTVEVSCHGGIFVTRKVLESILREGMRAADQRTSASVAHMA